MPVRGSRLQCLQEAPMGALGAREVLRAARRARMMQTAKISPIACPFGCGECTRPAPPASPVDDPKA